MAKKRQRQTQPEKLAYFVRRTSHVDDTVFFSDGGQRVYFEKASWAAWAMKAIAANQGPRVVRAEIQSGDRPYEQFLLGILPGNVTIREYLNMIETWTRDIMNDDPRALRRVTGFLRRQIVKHGLDAVYSRVTEE